MKKINTKKPTLWKFMNKQLIDWLSPWIHTKRQSKNIPKHIVWQIMLQKKKRKKKTPLTIRRTLTIFVIYWTTPPKFYFLFCFFCVLFCFFFFFWSNVNQIKRPSPATWPKLSYTNTHRRWHFFSFFFTISILYYNSIL